MLTDSLGRKVDFKNCVIIMTSNIGTKLIQKGSRSDSRARKVTKSAIRRKKCWANCAGRSVLSF